MPRRALSALFTLEPIPTRARIAIVACATTAMTLFALIDLATRNSTEWSIAYAVCVAFAAWYGGMWAGLPLSVYAGVLSFASAALAGGPAAEGERLAAFPIAVILALFTASLVLMRESLTNAYELARTDPLTEVPNSRAFYETAGAELARVRRYGGIFTLAYVDVDDFKQVNDRHGHAAGDALLKALAHSLADDTRSTDLLARIGGDEFVLLMPETGHAAASVALVALVERTRRDLSSHVWNAGLSVGAVTFLEPPSSVDDMVGLADAAMYAAKRDGKGRIVQQLHPAGMLRAAQAGVPQPAPVTVASPDSTPA
jgi:diguanylate cyclase (GGDEF)-like protein